MSDESGAKKADTMHVDHYCSHPVCKRWGMFGYSASKIGAPTWFCGEHRPDREAIEVR